MSESTQPYNEIDDYIAAFSEEERQDYVAAEMALDLASTLYQIRQAQAIRRAIEQDMDTQEQIEQVEASSTGAFTHPAREHSLATHRH